MKTIGLLLSFSLCGCSSNSFLWNFKSEDPVVVIDNPPMRLAYSGKWSYRDLIVLDKILKVVSDMPYKDHKYTFPLSAHISINEADNTMNTTSFSSSLRSKKDKK